MTIVKTFKTSKANKELNLLRRSFYSTMNNRINSYLCAPTTVRLLSTRAAKAGFFYTDYKDFIQCYNCNMRIGKWDINVDPEEVHNKLSPTCAPVIEQHRQDNMLSTKLTNALDNNQPIFNQHMVYQAVARLKHYLLFPTMSISDIEIDMDSSKMWHTTDEATRQRYTQIFQEAKQLDASMRKPILFPASVADTPFEWYQRTVKIKYWVDNGDISNTPTEITLKNQWEAMDPIKK